MRTICLYDHTVDTELATSGKIYINNDHEFACIYSYEFKLCGQALTDNESMIGAANQWVHSYNEFEIHNEIVKIGHDLLIEKTTLNFLLLEQDF